MTNKAPNDVFAIYNEVVLSFEIRSSAPSLETPLALHSHCNNSSSGICTKYGRQPANNASNDLQNVSGRS